VNHSVFNSQIKAQDTICLYLYKRVFPKWRAEIYHGQDISVGDNNDNDNDNHDDDDGDDDEGAHEDEEADMEAHDDAD
jgi:hypothetical protein